MHISQPNNFLFSSKYRLWRHILFWMLHGLLISTLWAATYPFLQTLFAQLLWLPVNLVYCYPFIYWVLPQFLLKGRYLQFAAIVLFWVLAGGCINYYFRLYIFIPLEQAIGVTKMSHKPGQQGTLFSLIALWCFLSTITIFKHWLKKQQEWLQAEKEKVTAELQLLKAQVHPHFLFNTLNNIYSFSLDTSPKVANLILKLSSLLRYMLYSCKADQVLLDKEIEVMKNYIDLEIERYGNSMEVSVNIAGDTKGKYISPLLLLPFLENAFKHGTSDQIEKPWLSLDLTVKHNTMKCKIVNSKNEHVTVNENGIGVQNVKKRLEFLYPGKHELKLTSGENFFVVSLLVELTEESRVHSTASLTSLPVPETTLL